ncbi:LysR family transcriptional regulator [Ramlibacter sp. 2FC]|uniref:LysR family transcriptional regulator n=1 Tax=Ramlibacter sp. 2FC TaxID=2502188 RepID=UPI0010F8AAD3|nr:LysR family transcriptional regulator [Ramlibacter sp. 2FC]
MSRDNITDVIAFLAIAKERSFTRAAAKIGVSQSALSHTIRGLEERIGVRLLTRTTRSVSPTEAGERLLQTVAPRFEEIESELAAVIELGEKPAGTIRITATDYSVDTVIWPRLAKILPKYPDLKVEVHSDYGLVDIVAQRYDMGVRWGDQVAKDMIAVRIAPDVRMVIVGAPSYIGKRQPVREPQDLLRHNCINLRMTSSGGVLAWELKKGDREVPVKVDGQSTFNGVYQMLNAAVAGCGLAFIPEDLAQPYVAAGQLQYVLEDWFPTFPGFHIYYPSRRQSSRALALVVDSLRYRP